MVPNVTRSENQPSNVSYIRIYIYIYTRATLRSPVPGRPRHIAAARLVYTNNRAFSANKKKLPSTCPKLLRQQLSCDAWRGVKGHHRRSLFVTAIVRTEPTGDSSTMETSWKLSSSDEIRQLLPTFCSFALNFIFDLLFGEGEEGAIEARLCLLSRSLSSFLRKDRLPFFQWCDLKGCSSGRKAR